MKKTFLKITSATGALSFLLPQSAFADPGHVPQFFGGGFLHLLTSPDHLIAIVAFLGIVVGLVAAASALRKRRAAHASARRCR